MTAEIAVWQIAITVAVLIVVNTFKGRNARSHKTVERKRAKAGPSAALRTRDRASPDTLQNR